MSGRWNPWRDLRGREHVTLMRHDAADAAGGAVLGVMGDRAVVMLSPSLDRVQRRVALGHELVHDERRITSPSATDATMEREEELVRRETARRLVPLDELEGFVVARQDLEPVTATVVSIEFDVTEPVAAEAMRQLGERMLGRELRRATRAR